MNQAALVSTDELAYRMVVIYTRVSTDEPASKEHGSCDVQEGIALEYLKQNSHMGWVYHSTIKDVGYTGANLNRPGIRELVDLVKRKKVHVVVVYRRDRLFRDTGSSAELQTFFDLHDVTVASVREGIYNQVPHAIFARHMVDAIAELERRIIVDRVRDSIRAAAQRGEWKAGSPSFGYSYTPGTKVLVVNEAEAVVVRFIFQAVVGGMSLGEVGRELRERGMLGRPGTRKSSNGGIQLGNKRFGFSMVALRRNVISHCL